MIFDLITFFVITYFVGLMTIYILFRKSPKRNVVIILNFALLFRIFITYYYYYLSLRSTADSTQYFYNASTMNFSNAFINLFKDQGTEFINRFSTLCYPFASMFENEYLMLSVPFTIIGFAGNLMLFKILNNRYVKFKAFNAFLSFFIPNVILWSCFIGKDSVIFFSLVLFIYSLLNMERIKIRFVIMFISLILIFFIRPHIFTFLILSFVLGTFISKKGLSLKNIVMVTFVILTFVFLKDEVFKFVGLGNENASQDLSVGESVSEGFEIVTKHSQKYQKTSGAFSKTEGIHLVFTPYYALMYLTAPYIWQARNIQQLLSAIENILYVFILFKIFINVKWIKRLNFDYKYFFIIYIILTSTIMGSATANFGIIVRQKTMVVPFLFLIFMAIKNERT